MFLKSSILCVLLSIMINADNEVKTTAVVPTAVFTTTTVGITTKEQTEKVNTGLTFERNIIHNGNPSAGIAFNVYKEDAETNTTWVCLRVELALEIDQILVIKSPNKQDSIYTISVAMSGSTILDEKTSTCTTLVMLFNYNSTTTPEQRLTLNFGSGQGTTSNSEDSHFFYLQSINADNIVFPEKKGFVETASTYVSFTKEQKKQENSTSTPTPIEVAEEDSFKCYNGFDVERNVTGLQEETNLVLKMKFYQIRLQYQEKPSTDDNINNGKIWKRTFSCDSDISTILPIVIGVVLGLIIISTIVGYLFARRRSHYAYEEI